MITISSTERSEFDFEAIALSALLIAERLRRGIIDAETATKQLVEILGGTDGR